MTTYGTGLRPPCAIVGLTGSVAMGKSTAAQMVPRAVPVFDSDAVVRSLMAPGGPAVAGVEAAFPDVVTDGVIDRMALGAKVFPDPAALKKLESVLHPLVRRAQKHFLRIAALNRRPVVVIDIPLLFETDQAALFDTVLVVSAPAFLQWQRLMRRPGQTPEKARAVIARQVPDRIKRQGADVIALTGLGKRFTLKTVRAALRRGHRVAGRRAKGRRIVRPLYS